MSDRQLNFRDGVAERERDGYIDRLKDGWIDGQICIDNGWMDE
jgi:hypothetical protein